MTSVVGLLAAVSVNLVATVPAAPPAVVAIDVGHYLERPGATSAYGVAEFEYNHSLAAVLAARLAAGGVAVRLIGHRGEMAGLRERPRQAEEAGASFFLSIHHDSVQAALLRPWVWQGHTRFYSEAAAGFSLFVSRKNPRLAESLACASAIGAALRGVGLTPTLHHAEVAPGIGRPWADETNGVYFYDDLVVLKSATVPALLFEAGVIVHPAEAAELATAARRRLTALAVERGLRACGLTGGMGGEP